MPAALKRLRVEEFMDSPHLGEQEHLEALRGLVRLNALSGCGRAMWKTMRRMVMAADRPVRVLDVATGSADIPLAVGRRARANGAEVEFTLCDVSERALHRSLDRVQRAGFRARTLRCDVLRDPLVDVHDVVTCSLFLHHFDPDDVVRILASLRQSTRRLLIVNDLRRTRVGMALVHVVPKLCTRSRIVWHDAVASVRAAYTIEELRQVAREAGLQAAQIDRSFPQRMTLTWRPNT